MEEDLERAQALEQWSIRVYQQLQAGYPIDAIRAQLDRVLDATPSDVEWILDRAKRRYIGYYEVQKADSRSSAKWMLWGGPLLAIAAILLVEIFGWSTAGRQNGRAIMAVLVGVGVFCYGAFCWFDAEPKGRRSDVNEL